MYEISQILHRIEQGEREASDELLPLVYHELRELARSRLAQENPGQTLQATALVHEAYLRLVGHASTENNGSIPQWDSRGHFFAAAAEAMRRILIEAARRKERLRHGGNADRQAIELDTISAPEPSMDILRLNEVLDELVVVDAQAAQLVKLKFFVGLTTGDAAEILGIPLRSAERLWSYARAWLFRELSKDSE